MWFLNSKSLAPWAYYERAFTNEECDKILEYCNTLKLQDATVGSENNNLKKEYRSNKIAWVEEYNDDNAWFHQKLTNLIQQINSDFWQFDLEYIAELQFTKYQNVTDQYKTHMDIGFNSITYRKLSFSLQLTDESEYEGCDLLIQESEKFLDTVRSRGSIIFFPSFMLHKVTPLERGERNCLVGWVCGPRFR